MSVRTGIGYDAHKLEAGRPLWLGGVQIDFGFGLAGHSDGDVLIHAVVDAILGAAGLGDIGGHFPSSDPSFAGVSSIKFLEYVEILLRDVGWRVSNLDATIIAEQPRISPHALSMRAAISGSLKSDISMVNIKSTTTDGMGFPGRMEGMAAFAIATIEARS